MRTIKEFMAGFEQQFSEIKDPRENSKTIYPMIEILFLAIIAVAGQAESWEEIELFGKAHVKILREYLPYTQGTPSDDTIRRFFEAIDPNEMNNVLIKTFGDKELEGEEGEEISKHYIIDGKTLRGSRWKEKSAFHFLNVYAAHSGLTIYGKDIASKENEITAIPEALSSLNLEGAIVSIDAIGCQKSIAKQITEKQGDYIFGLKMNHAYFYNAVEKAFSTNAVNFFNMTLAETHGHGHGREEIRKCRVIQDIDKISGYKDWAQLKSIIEVKRTITEKGKISESTNYYISSLPCDAESLLQNIRAHWKVESMHWIMDVVFNEDASKIRAGNAPPNMAVVRRFVLNILDKIKTKRQTRPQLMKSIGWSPGQLKIFIDKLIS